MNTISKIWLKTKCFFKSRPGSILILYWPFHEICYALLNKFTPTMQYHIIYTPFDDKIPFCEYFVLPYILWFFYIAATLIYFLVKNKKDYMRTSAMLIGGMVVSMIICAVYPTMHELRPAVMANNNFCTSIVKSLYSIDNAAVLLPSMHVLISCLLCIAIWTSESLKKNTLIKISSLILSVAICFSTVLIKQHSILDVILALILVMPFYWFGDFVGRKTS